MDKNDQIQETTESLRKILLKLDALQLSFPAIYVAEAIDELTKLIPTENDRNKH